VEPRTWICSALAILILTPRCGCFVNSFQRLAQDGLEFDVGALRADLRAQFAP
jgi:hypothetical protein